MSNTNQAKRSQELKVWEDIFLPNIVIRKDLWIKKGREILFESDAIEMKDLLQKSPFIFWGYRSTFLGKLNCGFWICCNWVLELHENISKFHFICIYIEQSVRNIISFLIVNHFFLYIFNMEFSFKFDFKPIKSNYIWRLLDLYLLACYVKQRIVNFAPYFTLTSNWNYDIGLLLY